MSSNFDQTSTEKHAESEHTTVRFIHMIAWLAVAVALFLASAAVGGSDSAEAAEADGVLFGAFAQLRGGESQIGAIQRLESDLGDKLPIIRSFSKWDSKMDNRLNNWVVDGDRRLMISVKPKRRNGQELTWRSIANAAPGSKIHNEMVTLARGTKNLNGEVWMTFHHEPEAKDRQSYGTYADFKAAWRKIHTVFEQQGADVKWVWTMTSWSFEVNAADRRSAGKWYPGDPYVDYLGADPYNWNRCRGNNKETWTSLERLVTPFMEFANQHPTKQLVLPEFASDEGSAGQKAAWLDDARRFLKRPEVASKFAAVFYFHDVKAGTAGCTWWLDSSTSTLNAARRIAADPFFDRNRGGVPTPPPPAPTPPPPQPVTGCTVRTTAQGDLLTWASPGDGFKYNVRRNGRWLAGSPTAEYLNTRHDNGNYIVIARDGLLREDLTCRRV
ncbi:MAG: hypothetical protein ACI81L_000259 [Verrucomicrobiales bacterium]|jgi:hypothetical protein